MDQFRGPCGVNLENYDTTVVLQHSSCKKKNKCKKSNCSCRVIIFELLSTGNTGSTGSTGTTALTSPAFTTHFEQFDPQPLAVSSLKGFLPLATSSNPQSNTWVNSLTGNIFKQFPNGYWYQQGVLKNSSSSAAFSASTSGDYQNVTPQGTVVAFTNQSVDHTNLTRVGSYLVTEDGTYNLHTKLELAQSQLGSALVEVEFFSSSVITKSLSKRKSTLKFEHLYNNKYVDSLEFSTVVSLFQGDEVKVRVSLLSGGFDTQVSPHESSFDGHKL